MSGETQITVIGNLTEDPEMRFTPSGTAVSNFTVASTPRAFKDGQWSDGDTLYLRCAAWKELGEHAAETLTKGMRVIVTGRLKQRSYETKQGEKRSVIEMEVDEVGPSLRYATAKVARAERKDSNYGKPQPQSNDVWGSGFGGDDQDPPF